MIKINKYFYKSVADIFSLSSLRGILVSGYLWRIINMRKSPFGLAFMIPPWHHLPIDEGGELIPAAVKVRGQGDDAHRLAFVAGRPQ
jgi:hypothetical protein